MSSPNLEPLKGDQEGSFAHDTIVRRLREEILFRVFQENEIEFATPELTAVRAKERLQDLDNELRHAALTPLRHIEGVDPPDHDESSWRNILEPLVKAQATWTTAPWLVAEFYFYRTTRQYCYTVETTPAEYTRHIVELLRCLLRRISEAVAFSITQFDAFENQKRAGLQTHLSDIFNLIGRGITIVNHSPTWSKALGDVALVNQLKQALHLTLLTSLWGNQADLSLWPASTQELSVGSKVRNSLNTSTTTHHEPASSPAQLLSCTDEAPINSLQPLLEKAHACVLSNDFDIFWDHLVQAASHPSASHSHHLCERMDIVADNVGVELVSDLLLIHFLLETGLAKKVVFHVKNKPVYVSDVMKKDVVQTLDILQQNLPHPTEYVERLRNYLQNDQLQIQDDPFFVLPKPLWDMPPRLKEEMQFESAVAFIKGDANYRRLLEDKPCAINTPFTSIVKRFPTRLLALRTLKSEIGCGIDVKVAQAIQEKDPQWKTNGRWGVLQFSPGSWSKHPHS